MPEPGDRFHELVDPEIEMLLRVARVLTRDHHEAEDLVQDTVLRAWRAIDRFDGAHPRAWLLTILRNTHRNRNRRRRPVLLAADDTPLLVAAGDDPADEAIARVGDQRLRDALHSLPARYRDAVVAVDLGALSYADAAALLGVPAGTVMSRVSRGRARLRAALQEPR
jgi:RNA polymerase sigma-70 factor (ECF subfamily)